MLFWRLLAHQWPLWLPDEVFVPASKTSSQHDDILVRAGRRWKVAKTCDLKRKVSPFWKSFSCKCNIWLNLHLPANLSTNQANLKIFCFSHVKSAIGVIHLSESKSKPWQSMAKVFCKYFNSLLARNGQAQFHTESITVLQQYGRLFLL